jgi:hypothetical protein
MPKISIQIDTRLEGEPFAFILKENYCTIVRVGPFKVFCE